MGEEEKEKGGKKRTKDNKISPQKMVELGRCYARAIRKYILRK